MSQRTHTCPSYNRLTPIAPYPAHAVQLNDWEVADLLATMRARYLHMTDAEAWDDPQLVNIAGHMAAGVKLCLDDLEWACQLAQRAAIERDRAM